jgi:ADP-heptose:LPS heptosyltransferase
LGDTYLSLSALPALKDMETDLLCPAAFKTYAEYFNLNKIFLLQSKKIKDVIELGMDMMDINYDYIFSFFPGRINTFFFNLAKSEIKCGYINCTNIPEWHNKPSKLSIRGKKKCHYIWRPENNYLDRIFYALYYSGIKPTGICKVPLPYFQHTIINKKFIVCNFSSRSKSRSLTESSINKILSDLRNAYNGEVYLLSDKQNKDFVLNYSDTENVLNYIISSEAFIGVDSFPLHIADAYNKKIIGLFSDTIPTSVFQNLHDKVGLKNPDINNISPHEIVNSLKMLNTI